MFEKQHWSDETTNGTYLLGATNLTTLAFKHDSKKKRTLRNFRVNLRKMAREEPGFKTNSKDAVVCVLKIEKIKYR